MRNIGKDRRDQERGRRSINSLLILRKERRYFCGPVEDDLAVRSTFGTKRNKWRTGVVEGRPQGEGKTHLTVTENSGVPSGPSQLPLGKCGFWVLVLILLLYNLGQVLYFAGSHFPK